MHLGEVFWQIGFWLKFSTFGDSLGLAMLWNYNIINGQVLVMDMFEVGIILTTSFSSNLYRHCLLVVKMLVNWDFAIFWQCKIVSSIVKELNAPCGLNWILCFYFLVSVDSVFWYICCSCATGLKLIVCRSSLFRTYFQCGVWTVKKELVLRYIWLNLCWNEIVCYGIQEIYNVQDCVVQQSHFALLNIRLYWKYIFKRNCKEK